MSVAACVTDLVEWHAQVIEARLPYLAGAVVICVIGTTFEGA